MNPFSRALDRATGARPIPGNIVRHIAVSSDALDAMLEMIAGAERTVHFENYMIHDDATGRRFATAWADRDKVTQVLMNLLGNALKFTPAHGHITVTIARDGAAWVQIAVADHGGEFRVESKPAERTIFTVLLPEAP